MFSRWGVGALLVLDAQTRADIAAPPQTSSDERAAWRRPSLGVGAHRTLGFSRGLSADLHAHALWGLVSAEGQSFDFNQSRLATVFGFGAGVGLIYVRGRVGMWLGIEAQRFVTETRLRGRSDTGVGPSTSLPNWQLMPGVGVGYHFRS